MIKRTKEKIKIVQKPRLCWMYVLYWVFAFLCFLSMGADFLSSYWNIGRSSGYLFIITCIGMTWRLCSILFLFMSILWISTLFFLHKKNVFYKKWLKTTLLVFLILFLCIGQRYWEYVDMHHCIDCGPGGG